MLLLQAERQLLMTIPYTKRHIFLLQSFVLVLGSLSGEGSTAQPTKKQIAMHREQKGIECEALVFMLISISW